MADPAVSVCIPLYNAAPFIGTTLASALGQTMGDLEAVVDDASIDGSAEVVAAIPDPRVRLVRRAENQGAEATWNEAVGRATGRYVKVVCHDDTLETDCLATQTAPLGAHPQVALCAGRRTIVDKTGRPLLQEGTHGSDPTDQRISGGLRPARYHAPVVNNPTATGKPAASGRPDIDLLIADLQARVQARRRAGDYPPGLEADLAEHFRRVVTHRPERRSANVHATLDRVNGALPLNLGRIRLESRLPAGETLHRAISRAVGRQTAGILQQVQAFAEPVAESLGALAVAIDDVARELRVEVTHHLDAIYERVAALERQLTPSLLPEQAAAPPATRGRRRELHLWYSAQRFEDEFRGGREEMLDRYRNLAERLVERGPVLDFGCGRGELLELLQALGVESWGIDVDPEMVKVAREGGLPAEHGEGLASLRRVEDRSLGALACIQVVEHLETQDVIDLVALTADKVRPGGAVFIETVNPQSLYVFARSFYVDPSHLRPVHPAFLTFLFQEAGFASVEIDWRSPPAAAEVLEEAPEDTGVPEAFNTNVRRLNRLLFAPQDYLLVAVR